MSSRVVIVPYCSSDGLGIEDGICGALLSRRGGGGGDSLRQRVGSGLSMTAESAV